MYIVKANFEEPEQTIKGQKNFLSEFNELIPYSSIKNTSFIVNCSSQEKAEKVKENIEETVEAEEITIEEKKEEEKKSEKIKNTLTDMEKGIEKGVQTAQKGITQAEQRFGNMNDPHPTINMLSKQTNGTNIKVILTFENKEEAKNFETHMIMDRDWNKEGFSEKGDEIEIIVSNEKGVDIIKKEVDDYDVGLIEVDRR